MSTAFASIKLDGNRRVYLPGQTLRGLCQMHGLPAQEITAVEISVLWHTEGKGDDDFAVHFFQRVPGEAVVAEGDAVYEFQTVLPHSPLSYDGSIVKIQWCVRMRVFLRGGKEIVEERPFRLGDLPTQPQQPAAATESRRTNS